MSPDNWSCPTVKLTYNIILYSADNNLSAPHLVMGDMHNICKSLKQANHALVFMVKGLVKNWKLFLRHFFYSGGINSTTLRELYESAIKIVQNTGFIVMFTVCDQEGVHRSLFQTLGMSKENPAFEINGERVHFFYDSPPHLLKSIRNTLLKYYIKSGGI